MLKKIFIISAILLGISLVFLLIYNLAFKIPFSSPEKMPSGNDKNSKDGGLFGIDSGKGEAKKISAIFSKPVIGPFFMKEESIMLYSAEDGSVFNVK